MDVSAYHLPILQNFCFIHFYFLPLPHPAAVGNPTLALSGKAVLGIVPTQLSLALFGPVIRGVKYVLDTVILPTFVCSLSYRPAPLQY